MTFEIALDGSHGDGPVDGFSQMIYQAQIDRQ
jgi:hypothetical protein